MRRAGHGRAIFIGLWTSALGMLAFGLSPLVGLSILSMIFVGGGFVIYSAASLTLIQALAPPRSAAGRRPCSRCCTGASCRWAGCWAGSSRRRSGARVAFAAAGLILLVSGVVVVLLRQQIVTLRVDRDGMTTADGVASTSPPENTGTVRRGAVALGFRPH